MIPQEIKETNKLIAEFMGASEYNHPENGGDWMVGVEPFPHPMHVSALEYNTSWDWLMPVINKIALIGMEEHTYNHTAGIVGSSHVCCSITTVYERVINFINTYNETNNITPYPHTAIV